MKERAQVLQCLHLPLNGFLPSVSCPSVPYFTSSLRNRGQMILDADDGNVARAHVKIKPIALSQRQGYEMVMDENKEKDGETLRKALTFMKFCLTG